MTKPIPECLMATLQNMISGKWKIYILWLLARRIWRFNELQRQLGDVTQAMLTRQLRELEKDGLIMREVFPEMPPRVEYSLSPLGKSFSGLLGVMYDWVALNIPSSSVMERR